VADGRNQQRDAISAHLSGRLSAGNGAHDHKRFHTSCNLLRHWDIQEVWSSPRVRALNSAELAGLPVDRIAEVSLEISPEMFR
jgi:hypothetical protein